MKETFHKSFSVAMALLLMLSTISWKVEKHYCMGHLIDVAFFAEADSCGMNMLMDSQIDTPNKMSCCDDEVIIIEGQDDLKLSFNHLGVDQQFFITGLTSTYLDLFSKVEELDIPLEQYPPPKLVKDIQLLDEVFLI